MSLSRTVAHGTSIQIVGKIASTFLGFLAITLMTRSLGAEQFGWYITAASFLQLIGVLSDFGFTVTTSNMLSESKFDRSDLLNTIFTWRLVTAIIFQGLAPIAFLFFPYPPEIKLAVGVMAISFFAQAINQVFIGLYREQIRALIAIMGEVVGRLFLVIGIALVAFGQTGFMSMMWAVTLAAVISTLYYSYFSPPIRLSFNRQIGRALFQKIWPTAISVIFSGLYYQIGRVLLPLSVSQTEVGYFGATVRIYDIVVQIAALIMGIMMPLVTYSWSHSLFRDFRSRFQLSLNGMGLVLIPSIIGLFVLANQIMLLFGAEFFNAATMLRWVTFALLGSFLGMTFGHIALAIDRQKNVLWIYVSNAILCLTAFFYFIPLFGWKGAAGVMIFSEFYAGILLMVTTIRYSQTRPSFVPLLKIVIAGILMGLIVNFTPDIFGTKNITAEVASLAAKIIFGSMVYAVLVVSMKVINFSTLKDVFGREKIA